MYTAPLLDNYKPSVAFFFPHAHFFLEKGSKLCTTLAHRQESKAQDDASFAEDHGEKEKKKSRILAIAQKIKSNKNYSGMYMPHEYVHNVAHSAHQGKKKSE